MSNYIGFDLMNVKILIVSLFIVLGEFN